MQAERTGGANVTILDFGEAEEVGPCTTRVGAARRRTSGWRRWALLAARIRHGGRPAHPAHCGPIWLTVKFQFKTATF